MKLLNVLLLLFLTPVSAFSADQPAVSVTNWQRINFTRISFSIPPGMTNVPVRGIDSLVGRCAGTNIFLEFDYGRYSNATSETTTPIQVGGYPARFAFSPILPNASSPMWTAGMTNHFLLAVPNVTPANSLRMDIFFRDPKDLPIARAIVDSIRF